MSLHPGEGDPTGEVTDLLRHLIRNACVNDGRPESGHEERNANVLESYLSGIGLDIERYEAAPGRESIVARIEGRDPSAPSLMLMGHTDVVPVTPERWERDPFGGELVDGVVWGRGAVDMLNLTSSMAVAFRRLARSGFAPRGTLIYLGVADEEALGTYGAEWLVENEPDAVRADYVVTEFGGMRIPFPTTSGPKYSVAVGEKGSYWCRIRVRGTAGHGSMPFRTDNALVRGAEVIRRIGEFAPATDVSEVWRRFVRAADLPPELAGELLDPARLRDLLSSMPQEDIGVARVVYSSTHTTFAPTVIHGGVKTNVIPDSVELEVDVRTLPGIAGADARAMIEEAIGPDLLPYVELTATSDDPSTASVIDTPLWDSLARVTGRLVPGSSTVPSMIVGATDARFFRRAGSVAYGAGLFSDRIRFGDFMAMFHGDDERVDQDSLRLSTELWGGLAGDLLG